MDYLLICLFIFLTAYAINITYVSIFYHRGFTHSAIQLSPWLQTFVLKSGFWITGIDPKAWSCMHRLHHQHSDTAKDPHSPVVYGLFGVAKAQLDGYTRCLKGLIIGHSKYETVVRDLDFPISKPNQNQLWYLAYVVHAVIALIIVVSGFWLAALAYFLGIMSHPIQGWAVNALAHRFGYRNFDLPDNSKNNLLVAWTVLGEGYQNNHHKFPQNYSFAHRWWEFDPGAFICRLGDSLGLWKILKHS